MTGINGMYQNNNVTKGTEFIIPSYRQFDIGLFIFVKKSIKKLEVTGGLIRERIVFKKAI